MVCNIVRLVVSVYYPNPKLMSVPKSGNLHVNKIRLLDSCPVKKNRWYFLHVGRFFLSPVFLHFTNLD